MSGPLRRNAEEILEALESAAHTMKRAFRDRQRDQADRIRDQNRTIRETDDRLDGDAGGPSRPVPDLSRPTPGDGPVTFRPPPDPTLDELQQFQRYIDTSNAARLDGQLSPSGRVSTQGALRAEASAAAATERARALAAGTPYQGQVGHAPDTTWTGRPVGREWHDQDQRVNASLGGQAPRYPVGYQPTVFQLEMPDGSIYPQPYGG